MLLVGVVGCIDLGPERLSTRVEAWFVGGDMLLSVFLRMVQYFTETTDLFVLVGIAALSDNVLPVLISHKKCMMFQYDYH
jgi:hypothetical protein